MYATIFTIIANDRLHRTSQVLIARIVESDQDGSSSYILVTSIGFGRLAIWLAKHSESIVAS